MRSAILGIRVMFLVLDNVRMLVYYASLQRLPLTHALKGFFLWFKPVFWWTPINRYHSFSRALTYRRFFLRFSSTKKNMSAFQPFMQYFAIGSDTASCQDYEEYEFVECFLEKTQIIDIFTHCKLQPRGVYNLVQISKPIVSPFEEETMPLSALYVFHYCFCTGSPDVVCVNILILT